MAVLCRSNAQPGFQETDTGANTEETLKGCLVRAFWTILQSLSFFFLKNILKPLSFQERVYGKHKNYIFLRVMEALNIINGTLFPGIKTFLLFKNN